jgi:hypothetical protein
VPATDSQRFLQVLGQLGPVGTLRFERPETFGSPRTLAYCPAKLASERSSAVAEDRTAQALAALPDPASALLSALRIKEGISSWAVWTARAWAAALAPAGAPCSCSLSTLLIGSMSASKARRNASAVTQNPGGTGNPASRRVPSAAAFAPTCWTSDWQAVSSETKRSDIGLSLQSPASAVGLTRWPIIYLRQQAGKQRRPAGASPRIPGLARLQFLP